MSPCASTSRGWTINRRVHLPRWQWKRYLPTALVRIMVMTPMPSTRRLDLIYAGMADARDRDPVVTVVNRATVPMGRGFALWRRMNPDAHLVWIDDAEGNPRAVTPKQAAVLALALEMIEGTGMTMREMAAELRMAPSTVSRALTKFAAWGLIAYIVGRGRYAGLVIFRRARNDGLERFRKAARERVARWSQYARDRLLSVKINVASMHSLKEIEDHGYLSLSNDVRDATLKRPWTPEDLRDAGII